ncbi:MAG: M23 family metallopeptidase [Syntrophomonadaceae bacterium]
MSRKKRRKAQHLTFLVIPENAGNMHKIGITRRKLTIAGVLGCLFSLLIIGVLISYSINMNHIRQVNSIINDNEEKRTTIEFLNQEMGQIKKQQEDISKKQEEIKRLMGIKTESSVPGKTKDGGQGGEDLPSNPAYDNPDSLILVQAIKTDLAKQDQELDDLIARVTNNSAYFRSVPNQWPSQGEISSDFGWRKSPFGGKNTTYHDGIDIVNSYGSPIVAAGDGKVTFTGSRGAYGMAVMIDHGSGFTTLYGHSSAILVKVGQTVRKGEAIARMGNTGRSTGTHVHFSVFKWGVCQDPMVYLP